MPALKRQGTHVSSRYAPYGHSAGVRHRGPRALARYGARIPARKRRAAKNRTVMVPRSKLAFPSGMRTKLRYVERLEFANDGADGVITKYAFLANSLTDPATHAGNHQPRGFDEFMKVYRSYTVLGSKVSVNFMYNGYSGPSILDSTTSEFLIQTNKVETLAGNVAAVSPVMVGIHKGVTELGAADTASSAMEQDRTVWKAMTPQDGSVIVSTSMATSDFFGKDALVGAEGYTGTITADADNLIYYTIFSARANDNDEGKTHTVGYVTIEYDVQFTEPKTLGES